MFDNFTVLTVIKNEPLRIIPFLENFTEVNVIVLLDPEDGQTEEILKKRSVKYIKRPSDFDAIGQPARTKWVLEQSPTDYVLIAYASFYVPVQMLQVFDTVARDGIYDGVVHSILPVSHGEYVQEPWILKKPSACYFFNRKSVNLSSAAMHNEFPLSQNKNLLKLECTRELSIHVFRDDDMLALSFKHTRYAGEEAAEKFPTAARVTLWTLIWSPIRAFLIGYLRLGGIRAGIPGLIYHLNYAWLQFLVSSRLWEMQNNKTFAENRANHVEIRMQMIGKDKKSVSVTSQLHE